MFTRSRDRVAAVASVLSSPLPIDAYVQMLDPLWSTTGIRARVEAVIPETSRAATIVLRPGRPLAFEAGQWIGVGVDIDGVRHRRTYSLTSVPGGRTVTITAQAIPDGLVSNHLVHDLRPGDIVHLEPPAGEFTLPAAIDRPLLFVTGGSGITPVMGMLRTLAAGCGILDAVVLHHAPSADEAIFASELAALAERHPGLRVVHTFTGAGAPPPEAELTVARLDAQCPDWRARHAWSCGPAPLLAAAESAWSTTDQPELLRIERFRPLLFAPDDPGIGGSVRFTASAADTVADGHTPLLVVAESAGLLPKHGCRMGICHSCIVPLVSGCVRDLRDGRVQRDPGDLVQICVSAAAGDVELEL